jgi:methionyl-tRNA formyltransferase
MSTHKNPNIIFFGTSELSVHVLEQLIARGLAPSAIVTVPDKPAGRKMELTPPLLKVWAIKHGMNFFQFEKLREENAITTLESLNPDIFIVASYGKIIPEAILNIPKHGALNVHPSLLPVLRGATPLQSAIMQDMQYTGVTIIKMDKEMDHGPIVAMHAEKITPWPQAYDDLEKYLAIKGANILVDSLMIYMSGKLKLTEQIHENATFARKIEKQDGLISLDELTGESGWNAFLKYNALMNWPGLFFFANKGANKGADKGGADESGAPLQIRVKVKEAAWNTALETMEILRVVPEGKKEMTWKEYLNYMKA